MRKFFLILALLSLSLPAAAETVRLGERWYDIALPARPKGAPLILALHGGAATRSSSLPPRVLPAPRPARDLPWPSPQAPAGGTSGS